MKPTPRAGGAARRSALFESALKGLFLSLWAYLVAVHPNWATVGQVVFWTLAGTGIGLILGAIQQILRGYRPLRNPAGFALLVLLDSPFFIYLGTIGGLGAGLAFRTNPNLPDYSETVLTPTGGAVSGLIYFALAGLLIGGIFAQVRRISSDWPRFAAGGVFGAILVIGCLWGATQIPLFDAADEQETSIAQMRVLGAILLTGIPFFYLLLFCGETEESEVEIGALFAALGLGLFLLRITSGLDGVSDKFIFLLPVGLYFVYATRILPKLRVFKHTMRGYGYLSLGRIRDSLVGFGRALKLNPKNQLATKGLYELHRKVDVTTLDPETVQLLNFDFCAQLAQKALIEEAPPTEAKRTEALRLLDLVEQYRSPLRPKVDYLKGVAFTHAKDFDLAAGYFQQILDPQHPAEPAIRRTILFDTWNMALRLHPEIVRRLGEPQLDLPGRRIEAIAAVERQLLKTPDDAAALELRALLYSGLTESEFLAASHDAPPSEFNYDYVEQLGLALVDEPDAHRAERGMGYLRIAGRGLAERAPSIFHKLADVATRQGDREAARGYLEQVKRTGLLIGPARLNAEQKASYLKGLKHLVEDGTARGDYANAVEDMRTLIEGGQEDVNSLRQLAELNALNNDVLNALLICERGLLYSKTDRDLLAKKDSYYYSVGLDKVKSVREKIQPWFDVEYCLKKAKAVVDQKEPDLETLDYGLHLVRLARLMKPDLLGGIVAEARLLLRKGERDAAVSLLEDVREKPKGSGDEEDAWFLATRILGEMYLNELNRPDLAVVAYGSYRDYHKAGAETLYQLALAHEANNNPNSALKCYESVATYKEHPRYWDATEAARRLKGG